jgi:hypothetical protein
VAAPFLGPGGLEPAFRPGKRVPPLQAAGRKADVLARLVSGRILRLVEARRTSLLPFVFFFKLALFFFGGGDFPRRRVVFGLKEIFMAFKATPFAIVTSRNEIEIPKEPRRESTRRRELDRLFP